MDFRPHDARTAIAAALLLCGASTAALPQTTEERLQRGDAVVRSLNKGAPSEDELKEVIYMVTVPAGFPRAIAASQALSALFAERRTAPAKQP